MVLGDFTLNGNHPTPSGMDYDIFRARFSPSGRVLWTKSAGGAGDDRPGIMGVAPNGDVLLPGSFTSDATFDPLVLAHSGGPGVRLWSSDTDGLLARYSRDGELRWAFSIGQPRQREAIWAPVVSSSGHCYFYTVGPDGPCIARLADWPGTNAPVAAPLVPTVPAE
jgi:outer membrane protein assembly factor BamB